MNDVQAFLEQWIDRNPSGAISVDLAKVPERFREAVAKRIKQIGTEMAKSKKRRSAEIKLDQKDDVS